MDPKLFGRYQIVRKLAGGGMGRVFLAYDPVLNRQVGLKLIDAGGDRDSLDVIAGGAARGYSAGSIGEARSERACGADLRCRRARRLLLYRDGVHRRRGPFQLVARGPLPPERAVGIALDVLDVLVKAHISRR